jgi:hypothetical protein
MDIYDYIKADHHKVANLFKQFEKALSDQQRQEIVEMISLELFIHAKSEENTFYKKIEAHLEYKKDINHGKHEHEDIFKLLEEINAMTTVNEAWKKKVLELKEQVEHHVKEEEGKIFSDAKKIFSEDEAWILKEQMHDDKEKILEKLASETEIK